MKYDKSSRRGAPSGVFAGYLMMTISLWHGSLLFPLRGVLFFGSFNAIPVISPEYMQSLFPVVQ